MAELNLPTLSIDIEADGSAAIRELNETADALDRLTDGLERFIICPQSKLSLSRASRSTMTSRPHS